MIKNKEHFQDNSKLNDTTVSNEISPEKSFTLIHLEGVEQGSSIALLITIHKLVLAKHLSKRVFQQYYVEQN